MTEFYVIMLKRADKKLYPDLHKTDGKIYLSQREADEAIKRNTTLKCYYHTVKLVASLPTEEIK